MTESRNESDEKRNHALIIIEEDVLDDPELHQVCMVDHGPESVQFQAVEDAHRELLADLREGSAEKSWRIVVEWYEDEKMAQAQYDEHVENAEMIA